jgi:4-amino-4-deoxy-L-arabinose transferase-like glycosyltransferase
VSSTLTAPHVAPTERSRLRARRAAILVALLTTLNALAWGLIVPPFHVPDETSHVFYAQYLGETGKLPKNTPDTEWYSIDEARALARSNFYSVIGRSDTPPPWTRYTQSQMRADSRANLDRVGAGNAASASNNPPLYYLPQAAVYRLAHGQSFLERLAFMRVLSALLAGLTALCVFAFLRETLPGSPLAWTVGALLAGLQPMFAFIASGVNNDGGLYLVTAALLWALARLMRRGLTPRRAAAVCALVALGILVKTQAIAYVPAVALAFALVLWRERRFPAKALAWGAAAGAAPLALYGLLGATIWDRPIFDRVSEVTAAPGPGVKPALFGERLNYIWQEFLPRVPLTNDMFPGLRLYNVWFKGLVGRFGWVDYGYPAWAYTVALVIALAVAAAAAVHLWQRRASVRRHLGEALVYLVLTIGLCAAVGYASYGAFLINAPFDQARYLLPLLPLFALMPALAVRAAGPRWAPLVGVSLVLIALGYSVFAQLLTLGHYYV